MAKLQPMTKKDLSTVAGYSYRRLHDIDQSLPENKKLFIPVDGTKCDLPLFVQHWVDYNVSREATSGEDLDLVKAKHEVVKTQKTELEVQRLRGQLVSVTEMKRLWADIANTVMHNFLHLSSKIAPQVRMMDNTEQIAYIIDEEVRVILENIADTPLPDYVEDGDTEE